MFSFCSFCIFNLSSVCTFQHEPTWMALYSLIVLRAVPVIIYPLTRAEHTSKVKIRCLQWLSKITSCKFGIAHVIRQRVPDSRASNVIGPMAVVTEPIAWDGDLVTVGRMFTLHGRKQRQRLMSTMVNSNVIFILNTHWGVFSSYPF